MKSWKSNEDESDPKKQLQSQENRVTTLTIHNDDLYKRIDFLNPDEKNHKHVEVTNDFNLPVSFAIVFVIIYMIVGGFLLSYWENWTYFEAFYFIFISMTTIGFGDYVLKDESFLLSAFTYLVFGLMLTSMCINVIQEKLTVTFQKARVRIGNNTVLNVGALLEDEDHKSRMPHNDPNDSDQDDCYGMKINVHRSSFDGREGISYSTIHNRKSYTNTLTYTSQDGSFLTVPHRFTFYDSPYSTVQNERTIPAIKNDRRKACITESNQDSPYNTAQNERTIQAMKNDRRKTCITESSKL